MCAPTSRAAVFRDTSKSQAMLEQFGYFAKYLDHLLKGRDAAKVRLVIE